MPQIHFSVDEETAKALAGRAKAEGMSLSSYVARTVRRQLLTPRWPDAYLGDVVGACADSPISEAVDLPLDDVEL